MGQQFASPIEKIALGGIQFSCLLKLSRRFQWVAGLLGDLRLCVVRIRTALLRRRMTERSGSFRQCLCRTQYRIRAVAAAIRVVGYAGDDEIRFVREIR